MKTKHYWAMYYGVEETLPDKEFYEKINAINQLATLVTITHEREERGKRT